MGSTKETS